MFEKAVICTDLGSESDALVACAGTLSALGMKHAVLTHLVDVFGTAPGGVMSTGGAEETFARQMALLEARGIAVRVEAPLGHPAFSLEEVRKRHGASLIVVGSQGRGMFDHPLSGSISSDLVQLSEAPVLVTNFAGGADGGDMAGLLGNVLLCTDFSAAARRAFDVVVGLAARGIERATLCHVQDSPRIETYGGDMLAEYDRKDAVRLAQLKERLLTAGVGEVITEIVHASPGTEIADRAESGEYTLIVLGSRGRAEQRQDGLLGGVSDRALRSARSPLLLIPAPMSSVTTPA